MRYRPSVASRRDRPSESLFQNHVFVEPLDVLPRFASVTPPPLEVLVHLPSYGALLVPAPDTPRADLQTSDPYTVKGEVEVRLTPGQKHHRCHGIRMVLRSWCILDISSERKQEEDVFFEQVFPLIGNTVFNQRSQRLVQACSPKRKITSRD